MLCQLVLRNGTFFLDQGKSLAPIPESEEEFEEQEDEKAEVMQRREDKKEEIRQVHVAASTVRTVQKVELGKGVIIECASKETDPKFSFKHGRELNSEPKKSTTEHVVPKAENRESAEQQSKGWQTIPKPKGHSALDYARWDSVDDDSSEDDDEDEDDESLPQYRFRVKTVGVRPVK
jgi:hypothetical protein